MSWFPPVLGIRQPLSRGVVGTGVTGNWVVGFTYDYLITDDAEWTSTFALGAATLSGKTIAVAPGNYTSKTISSFNPATMVTLKALDPTDKPVLAGLDWGSATNLRFVDIAALSVTQSGVTFNFSAGVVIGRFEDGSPYALSSQTFNVTSITPASAVINGGVAHGTQANPYLSSQQQGFDQFIASGNASADIPYNAALNIDPGATGTPIVISSGSQTSLVKAVRVSGMTSADGRWQTIDRYVVLTVLASRPPDGSYRPGVSSLSKFMLNRSSFDSSVARALTLPVTFTDTAAQAIAKLPPHIATFGIPNGEQGRRLRTDVALGTTTTNYSRDLAPSYAYAILQMHRAGLSTADRELLLARIATFATDIYGFTERGFLGNASRGNGAGQSGAYQPFIFAAAFLFQSQTLLTAAQSLSSSMLGTAFWITASDFDVETPGKSGSFAQAYLPEMVGLPWYVPDEETSDVLGRYLAIAGTIMHPEIMVTSLWQNGPGGVNGLQAMLNGPNDNTNPRAAAVAYMSQRRNWSPDIATSEQPQTRDRQLHDVVAGLVSGYAWEGPPHQIPYGTATGFVDNWFTGGDGAINYDVSAVGYATQPITRHDLRYSLDQRSWVQVDNVGASGSITGLLRGVPYFVQMRRHSAAGVSPWSGNFPRLTPISSEPPRGRPTTTGTATAASPVNTVAPILVRNTRKAWPWGLWVPAVAFDSTDITVSCGVGVWTGFPAPTFTYQWFVDGVLVSGATQQDYTCRYADLGKTVTCRVTATNASGSANVTTSGLTVAAYEGFFDTFSTNTVPNYTSTGAGVSSITYNSGSEAMVVATTASFAGAITPVFSVIPGVTYRILGTITAASAGTYDMLTNLPGGTGIISSPNSALGRITAPGTIDWNYTPAAGVTSIRVTIRTRTATPVTFTVGQISVNRV
jgi:hypothetical protein